MEISFRVYRFVALIKNLKMSVTILEALQNANYNIRNNGIVGITVAKEQLHNAVILLEKGYSLNEDLDSLLNEYENIADVPDKDLSYSE